MRRLLLAVLIASLTGVAGEAGAGRRSAPPAGARPAPTSNVTVTITNFQFTPKTVTVVAGTTVVWNNEAGRHMVESDGGLFKSDVLTAGKTFEFTFTKAGRYPYHCTFHGESGGKDMAGTVVVTAAKK